jgi:hypothetical protein
MRRLLLTAVLGVLVGLAGLAACGQGEMPLTYTNDQYGFTLEFPDAWKGYKAHSAPFVGSAWDGPEPSANIQFDLPGPTPVFAVQVWDDDVWQQAQAEAIMIPDVLAERDHLVFTILIMISVPEVRAPSEEEVQSRLAEVQGIIQTFELD